MCDHLNYRHGERVGVIPIAPSNSLPLPDSTQKKRAKNNYPLPSLKTPYDRITYLGLPVTTKRGLPQVMESGRFQLREMVKLLGL